MKEVKNLKAPPRVWAWQLHRQTFQPLVSVSLSFRSLPDVHKQRWNIGTVVNRWFSCFFTSQVWSGACATTRTQTTVHLPVTGEQDHEMLELPDVGRALSWTLAEPFLFSRSTSAQYILFLKMKKKNLQSDFTSNWRSYFLHCNENISTWTYDSQTALTRLPCRLYTCMKTQTIPQSLNTTGMSMSRRDDQRADP